MRTLIRKLLRSLIPHALRPSKLFPRAHDRDSARFGWRNFETHEWLPGFPIQPADTLADIGCGDGAACLFAAACGAEVIGVDILAEKIDRLRAELAKSKARASQAIVASGRPLPLPDACATKIVCQEVLEHVDDPAQMMSELVRIGKPGARYLLTVPDPVSEKLQQGIAPACYWAPPNHVRIFQREEFARLVIDAGLRIERRTSYGFYWTMWWVMFWGGGKAFKPGSGDSPPMKHWNRLWASLIADPKYANAVKALEECMPKSQIIIAVKESN